MSLSLLDALIANHLATQGKTVMKRKGVPIVAGTMIMQSVERVYSLSVVALGGLTVWLMQGVKS